MVVYILRRMVVAMFILLVAAFAVYWLVSNAGDPLTFTYSMSNPDQRRDAQLRMIQALNLNDPIVERFFKWLGSAVRGDFGDNPVDKTSVNADLWRQALTTLKLVSAALGLSVLGGVVIGVLTSLRQYSGFDYVVTFFTFVCYSVPVFFVAVILKSVGAIQFNDFLRDGDALAPALIVVIIVGAGLLAFTTSQASNTRRLAVAGVTALVVGALTVYVSESGWLRDPGFGPVLTPLLGFGCALLTVAVMVGWRNQRMLYIALGVAAIGTVLFFFPLPSIFDDRMSIWWLFGLAAIALLIGGVVGAFAGGYDRGLGARVGAISAFLFSVVVFVDRSLGTWKDYSENSAIRNRPIKTIGDRETRLSGDFWIHAIDTFSHLALPTLTLMLISLASYTRYSRASMLEVLNQDYIRTARAKGLTMRTVTVRHAFRNALIPLTTIVAFDIGGVLGGAVITERVFEWNGMGTLFVKGLQDVNPNPVMAFFVVVGLAAIIANLLADIAYAALDPRIRIRG